MQVPERNGALPTWLGAKLCPHPGACRHGSEPPWPSPPKYTPALMRRSADADGSHGGWCAAAGGCRQVRVLHVP
ncbi:MAG: hypothetical protein ACK55Z_22600, partial [bacterium]